MRGGSGGFLGRRPGEGRAVALIVGQMFVTSAGVTIGENGVNALFFDRIGRVEHGCNIQPDQIERMAAAGAAWCPTITLVSGFMLHQEVPDPDYQTRVRTFYNEELAVLLPQAAALGVPILAGSDTIPPADFWQEIAALHRYGLDAETAIASATTTARSYLGLRDLEEGAPADVVLYHADPRHDPEVLQRPALVMVGGNVIGKAGASA